MSFNLHFHCGDWVRRPNNPDCILVGQLTATQADMSQYGYGLSEIYQDTHVFSNDSHVLNGLRRAVIDGRISHTQITIYYYNGPETTILHMDDKGTIPEWPQGFFDQMIRDTAYIGRHRRQGKALKQLIEERRAQSQETSNDDVRS